MARLVDFQSLSLQNRSSINDTACPTILIRIFFHLSFASTNPLLLLLLFLPVETRRREKIFTNFSHSKQTRNSSNETMKRDGAKMNFENRGKRLIRDLNFRIHVRKVLRKDITSLAGYRHGRVVANIIFSRAPPCRTFPRFEAAPRCSREILFDESYSWNCCNFHLRIRTVDEKWNIRVWLLFKKI